MERKGRERDKLIKKWIKKEEEAACKIRLHEIKARELEGGFINRAMTINIERLKINENKPRQNTKWHKLELEIKCTQRQVIGKST